jgi:hypothetical protein
MDPMVNHQTSSICRCPLKTFRNSPILGLSVSPWQTQRSQEDFGEDTVAKITSFEVEIERILG